MRALAGARRGAGPGGPRGGLARGAGAAAGAAVSGGAGAGPSLAAFSPAKVNLFLRVMRRRDDGFHDLASLFHAVSLGDRLEIKALPSGSSDALECDAPGVPTDSSNLVIKALEVFRARSGTSQRFACRLHKAVPSGAGLGGGSGNAATAMWLANEAFGRPATERQLLEWSADVGSDCPFFLSSGAAYCTGRGEVVEDVPPPLPLDTPLLLVKPSIGLSTPAIFKALDLDSRSSADPEQLLAGLATNGASPEVCVNDLEPPAFAELPRLGELKDRLAQDGSFDAVFMSGSGSTIVGVGSEAVPQFLNSAQVADLDLFVSPARLIVRNEGEWFREST